MFVSDKKCVSGVTTDFVTCFSGLTLGSIPLFIPCTSGKIMPLVLACGLV